jgi:hypothetical protein
MFYYIEKSRQDGIITLQEIEGFRLIMTQYKNEINSIKEVDIDYETIKKEAEILAKKEIKLEIKDGLKQELLLKYHGQKN